MSDRFLCLHLCSGEPALSICLRDDVYRCEDDPPPWYITDVGGWRVYPYHVEPINMLVKEIPTNAIDIFTGAKILADAPKFDLVAAMRKRFPVEPIKRRI